MTISFRTHQVSKFRFRFQKLALIISTVLLFIPLFLIAGDPISPPPPDLLFYSGQDYGSESQFGPMNVFVNVGLVTIGHMTQSPELSYINFKGSGTILVNSLLHQRRAINSDYDNGFIGFFRNEFLPPNPPALPNYFMHLIGEGMLSRKLEEYYRFHGMQGIWPKVLAVSTIIATQQMNELVEFGFPMHPKSDPVADLYFNTAGIVAFSYDGVARLFSNEYIRLYYWPGQPVIDIRDGALYNHGESFLLRTTLGKRTDWKLSILFGMPANGLGVSVPVKNGDLLTIAPFTTDLITRPRGYIPPTLDELNAEIGSGDPDLQDSHDVVIKEFYYAFGAYWDRQGSLLAGLTIGYHPAFSLCLNVYPGIFNVGPVGLGGYLTAAQHGAGSAGITLSLSPAIPGVRF